MTVYLTRTTKYVNDTRYTLQRRSSVISWYHLKLCCVPRAGVNLFNTETTSTICMLRSVCYTWLEPICTWSQYWGSTCLCHMTRLWETQTSISVWSDEGHTSTIQIRPKTMPSDGRNSKSGRLRYILISLATSIIGIKGAEKISETTLEWNSELC